MSHKFRIGQTVSLIHDRLRASAGGAYEIRWLVPATSSGETPDPAYRIKSIAEQHERVASESQLAPTDARS